MNRGLVFSLCAAVMAVVAAPALAVVDVQLNLRYTDPNNPTGGGTWDLLVQDSAEGLSGLKIDVLGDLGVTGIDTPLAAITPNAAVFTNTNDVFRFQPITGGVEIVAGDDLSAGALITGVGTGSGPGNVAKDDLFPTSANSWDNSALIASGTWTGARPTLGAMGANELVSGAATQATFGVTSVRGDSVGVDGLLPGDANRDGKVTTADFSILSSNFNGSGGWDQGDFNSSGTITTADFSSLSSNFNGSATSPAISSVPEPSTVLLLGLGLAGVGLRALRK